MRSALEVLRQFRLQGQRSPPKAIRISIWGCFEEEWVDAASQTLRPQLLFEADRNPLTNLTGFELVPRREGCDGWVRLTLLEDGEWAIAAINCAEDSENFSLGITTAEEPPSPRAPSPLDLFADFSAYLTSLDHQVFPLCHARFLGQFKTGSNPTFNCFPSQGPAHTVQP
jgi:hypothetical protein